MDLTTDRVVLASRSVRAQKSGGRDLRSAFQTNLTVCVVSTSSILEMNGRLMVSALQILIRLKAQREVVVEIGKARLRLIWAQFMEVASGATGNGLFSQQCLS